MEKAKRKSLRDERRKSIANFTLMDDTFMGAVFGDNPECVEQVLNIVLKKRLKVERSEVQYELKNLKGSSARLDVFASDKSGKVYNIEIQRENNGAKPRRARRNGSLLDANCPDSGKYGEKLPETYVIFITEKDYWGEGEPLYLFERKCSTGSGKNIDFNDGLHIIYVNGKYRGADKLGDLMRDFACADADKIKNGVLRKVITPLKTTEEGAMKMDRVMDRLNKLAVEYAIEDEREDTAMKMIKEDIPIETISRITNFPESRILELQREMLVEA